MKKIITFVLASVMMLFCFTGCAENTSDTVMTVNGSEVSWDEYMYWIGYATSQLEQYYSYSGNKTDYTDSSTTDIILKDAKNAAVEQHVILAKAAELGITADEDEVNDVIKNYISQYCGEDGTEEDFAELIKDSYATVDTFKTMVRSNLLYGQIINKLYGENGKDVTDEQVKDYAEENDYITATHILLLTTDDEGNPISEKEQAKLKEQAEGFVKELKKIKDNDKRLERFNELKAEYCQDTGKESFPDGYCFTKGAMVDQFDSAARELKSYEVSDVVQSDYGFHVIMRLPLTGDDLSMGSSGYPTPLRAIIAEELFNKEFDQWKDDAEVEFVGKFKKYDFSSLFGKDGFNYLSYKDFSSGKDAKDAKD